MHNQLCSNLVNLDLPGVSLGNPEVIARLIIQSEQAKAIFSSI